MFFAFMFSKFQREHAQSKHEDHFKPISVVEREIIITRHMRPHWTTLSPPNKNYPKALITHFRFISTICLFHQQIVIFSIVRWLSNESFSFFYTIE